MSVVVAPAIIDHCDYLSRPFTKNNNQDVGRGWVLLTCRLSEK